MGGFERGVRGDVTRAQIWQGFLDWLRPIDHDLSASQHAMSSAGASTDLVAPMALTGGALAGKMSGDEALDEIDEDELLEFLEADHDPVPADPVFREQLRDQLWALVHEGVITRPKDH